MPADPNAKGIKDFQAACPRVWQNLVDDIQLEDSQKEEFYRHLEAHTTGDLKTYCENFFRRPGKKLQGDEVALRPGQLLGAVRTHGALVDILTRIFGHTVPEAEAFLASLLTLEETEQVAEIADVIGDKPYARFLVWSFSNSLGPVYEGLDVNSLPCVLGLPSFGTTRHYTFAHDTSRVPTKAPTFFDAEMFDQWRPGGSTYPHPPCRSAHPNGLPEVVHEPNLFTEIKTRILEIT